jgi:hypothetical protein
LRKSLHCFGEIPISPTILLMIYGPNSITKKQAILPALNNLPSSPYFIGLKNNQNTTINWQLITATFD